MHQSLVNHVREIWDQKVNPPAITLQTLADVVAAWEDLFREHYERLDDRSSIDLADALGVASRTLIVNGYFGAATQLLIAAWKQTGNRQRKAACKIYRAAIAFYLSEIYVQRGDRGAAFWWQLHALADDYLQGGDGGGARIVLETILGIPKGAFFQDLKAIAVDHRKVCEQAGWQTQQGFAEEVVVKFAIRYPEYASMFAYPTGEIEFPVSPGYLSTLCEDIENDPQGKKLEYIACFLFLHIPGCTPAHDLLDQDRAMQTDVVIRNLTPHSSLAAETFGRYFVIECKNLAAKVGSAECGYFLHRIHLMHFTFGVMLAKEGVTGSPEKDKGDEEAARQLIRRCYHEDGLTCIVLSLHHLQRLSEESTTLRAMLFEEIERFRFGSSNSLR